MPSTSKSNPKAYSTTSNNFFESNTIKPIAFSHQATQSLHQFANNQNNNHHHFQSARSLSHTQLHY